MHPFTRTVAVAFFAALALTCFALAFGMSCHGNPWGIAFALGGAGHVGAVKAMLTTR